VAVIPARYESKRFPGKVIAPLAGKPLVVHTYEQACKSTLVSRCVIATDDARVAEAVKPYGAEVVMTRTDHATGTDRLAEVAEAIEADIYVNVQGDEPLIDPKTIDDAIGALLADPELPVATARRAIDDPRDVDNPNVVKVVCSYNGRALYFSRSTMPYDREAITAHSTSRYYWQHIGLYVYRHDFLLRYASLPMTPLEEVEKLEQLRILEHGYSIAVVPTEYRSIGVDTPEDLARVSALLAHAEGIGF
jgi:3-deoxy-manno-octulosonate cytidylyltransferase (CMP-KDO synthetase)